MSPTTCAPTPRLTGDEEHLELFDEAVNDGASFVFNLWGEEEENDGDAIHWGLWH